MTKLSKNFTDSEFVCPCCNGGIVSPILIDKLQQLRDLINKPIIVTSGYRCSTENKKVGGHSHSPHTIGEAADIKCKGAPLIFLAHIAANNIKGIRIGIYPNHLHIDIRPANPSLYWLVKKYGNKPIYSKREKNLAKFLKNNM